MYGIYVYPMLRHTDTQELPAIQKIVNITLTKLYITIKKHCKVDEIPVNNNCSRLCTIFLKWYTIAIVKKLQSQIVNYKCVQVFLP